MQTDRDARAAASRDEWAHKARVNLEGWNAATERADELEARVEAAERALAEYEASVMGVLARLPNHWQQYRDPLEFGEGIRKARLLGREALDRVLADV